MKRADEIAYATWMREWLQAWDAIGHSRYFCTVPRPTGSLVAYRDAFVELASLRHLLADLLLDRTGMEGGVEAIAIKVLDSEIGQQVLKATVEDQIRHMNLDDRGIRRGQLNGLPENEQLQRQLRDAQRSYREALSAHLRAEETLQAVHRAADEVSSRHGDQTERYRVVSAPVDTDAQPRRSPTGMEAVMQELWAWALGGIGKKDKKQ